jgi:hypothetical protein
MTGTRPNNGGDQEPGSGSSTDGFADGMAQAGVLTNRPAAIAAEDSRSVISTSDTEARTPVSKAPAEGMEKPAEPASTDRFEGPVRTLVSIGANITVLTALLVFFGWKRSEAHAQMLGIDESILGMSPQDYAFRSVNALFPLLAVIAVAGLSWLWIHAGIAGALQAGRRLRPIGLTARALTMAWFVVPGIFALFSWRFPTPGFLVFPLSFAVGTLLTCYGIYLRSQLQPRAGTSPAWQTSLTKVFVAVVVTLSLFWEVSNYATVIGEGLGQRLAAELPLHTQVVVYSPKRLSITAPNVREEPISGSDTAYRFRYSGLRFLNYTGGKYILVSDGWSPRYGVVVLLADSDPVRFEFVRDLRPSTPSSTNPAPRNPGHT